MGKCIKTVLAYKERWWHSTSGFADPSLGTRITLVFDVSRENEPMLATFFYGDSAVEYSGNDKKGIWKEEAIKGAQLLVGKDPENPDPRSLEPLSVWWRAIGLRCPTSLARTQVYPRWEQLPSTSTTVRPWEHRWEIFTLLEQKRANIGRDTLRGRCFLPIARERKLPPS